MSLATLKPNAAIAGLTFLLICVCGPTAAAASAPATASSSPTPSPTPSGTPSPAFTTMRWREIGPALPGGRVAAVAGSATDSLLYYLGSAGGGVWKSTDGAETWSPVFEKQPVSAIGAVAISPDNNNVVWVGTGESNPRQDVSYGDGIYKSTDGGGTWKNVGLAGTRHISRILIDPQHPNHVIVAALGNIYGDSPDRGVYVTDDGGATWNKTLYLSEVSGASDVAMDVQHPNVIYAGMWHFRREPWTFTSGGTDDGLFKSTDGGHTWRQLTGNGLPSGMTGKIGLAVAPSNGNRVYALIESREGLLYRSDDAGASWTMVNKKTDVDGRPFYFTRVAVDTKNPDRLYTIAFQIQRSDDGGKTIKTIAAQVHVDFHAMWIDPNNPSRMIVGNDGGIARSLDGGDTWFFGRNIPIGQVYRVGTSIGRNPYTICGGWQDNNAWCGPSNSLDPGGIQNKNWVAVNGGDGQFVIPDPLDPNWVWSDSQGGSLLLFNTKTKDFYAAQPYLANALESFDQSKSKYRFNWESPIAFAPWDGHIAWLGGNVVFQTTDRARHWTVISPDLTLNDKGHQQPAGGPLVHDVSGAEYSDNILDIEGSPLTKGEIWVGTDDGLVQLTRDGGRHWSNVTPPAAPRYGRVESIAPSALDPGTAYANFDVHVSNDFHPYIFVTHDYGHTWKAAVAGLPADQYVRSVRPDLHNRNIVYAGTENGMWISLDGGNQWLDFKNNLPSVAVHDIRFQTGWDDLLIATHGRSLYVMDDMRPLQENAAQTTRTVFFSPRTAYEYNLAADDEGTYTDYTDNNPPYGAAISFYQPAPSKTVPSIQILDSRGHVIRTIKGTHKVDGKDEPYVPNKAGVNSYVWDFQVDGPVKWNGAAKGFEGPSEGPGVPPGRYGVRLKTASGSYSGWFDVKPDPRTAFTQKDFLDSFAFNTLWYRRYSTVNTALNSLDDLKKTIDADLKDQRVSSNAALTEQLQGLSDARASMFDLLTPNFQAPEEFLQKPGALRENVAGVLGTGIVTPAVLEAAGRVAVDYRRTIVQYNDLVKQVKDVSAALERAGLKPIAMGSPLDPN